MIDTILYFGTEIVLIRIDGRHITFGANTSFSNPMMSTIEGLNLSKAGVIKEFPDLADRFDWREEAIARFKYKIKGMKSEEEIWNYLINDLKKYGYVPKYKQVAGHRREVIK